MTDEDLLCEVRALRARGLSPKEIARSLGVRPAAVADLVRVLAAENGAHEETVECWINPGWSVGLGVSDHPEWHDPGGDAAAGGLVSVLIARRRRHRRSATVCVYLLDVYCLGVKNALGPERLEHEGLREFAARVFRWHGEPPIPAPIELARELVFGAADYAGRLGFAPHPDFEPARAHLGPWSGPSSVRFGCNGKPTYVEGPYDDAEHVVRSLRRAVGPDGFHYTIGVDLSDLRIAG